MAPHTIPYPMNAVCANAVPFIQRSSNNRFLSEMDVSDLHKAKQANQTTKQEVNVFGASLTFDLWIKSLSTLTTDQAAVPDPSVSEVSRVTSFPPAGGSVGKPFSPKGLQVIHVLHRSPKL